MAALCRSKKIVRGTAIQCTMSLHHIVIVPRTLARESCYPLTMAQRPAEPARAGRSKNEYLAKARQWPDAR